MQLTDNWIDLIPQMINASRRKRARISEFEPIIVQHSTSAAEYASVCIDGPWPEAEDVIATDANASYQYAKRAIKGRWEKGEQSIATDSRFSTLYAKDVLRGPFPIGESAIASSSGNSLDYARHVLKGRFVAGEAAIAKTETDGASLEWARMYYELVVKNASDWASWTEDQIKLCPCWMYMYAKDYLKGRLPDVLHNHMIAFGMTLKDDYFVKKYFKAKRYQKKVKYRRKKKFSTIAEEVTAALGN